MNFYDELQARTQDARQSLISVPLIQRGARGEISLEEYVAFLTQAYYHVKHTVPLLMACGSRLSDRQEWLREAIAEYIEEETGHQEWILNDIAACGADAEAVRNGQPNLSTELMVAYAYDTIARGNPLGFFGMVNVLEGTSIALATSAARAIQESLALPNRAFSYLLSHGDLDIGHIEFFKGLMNRIEDEEDKATIVHSARVMFRLYGDIFREVESRCAVAEVA
ncbi:iron-containing redox enzyme family protein [Microbulbifer magnicolonia]|uniref:TenA family transcriptional regulator n=1 Tax=Microbulbifer magnicolonia TaxID=3109744 RepID=UPI002B403B00|nr:iron-containing redox enzyme family protein [Microbulbifer sp. GG15]